MSTVQNVEECQTKADEKNEFFILSRKERKKYEKEARERDFQQSLQQAEDEFLQQALLASLEDIPMIERAHTLVQRAASEAKRKRLEKEMQEARENLFEHMLGALPLLAGLVSKETLLAMPNSVPKYEPIYGLLRHEQQTRYREFVKFYMAKWLSEQTWRGSLEKEHIDTVVEQVENTINAQTTPILGWLL